MKITNILATSALALACVTAAQADSTVIRIAGSSAFRAATVNAAIALLDPATVTASYDSGSATSGNAANVHGYLLNDAGSLAGGSEVTICFSWTGSAGGLDCVANNKVSTVRGFIDAGTYANGVAAITDTTSTADIATSDVYPETSGFDGMENLVEASDSPVGVCPFKWVISGASTDITNITPQQARALFKTGYLSKAVFTGVVSDTSTKIYATGRDADSGTRITAFAETGVGAASPVYQYVLTDGTSVDSSKIILQDSGYGTPLNLVAARAMNINGLPYAQGNTGYASGGNLAKSLRLIPNLTGTNAATAITYLSTGDAKTALGTSTPVAAGVNATELKYNGVTYSDAAVQQGLYTFWSYEHLCYKAADAGEPKGDFAEALATEIMNNHATDSGLAIASMKVKRSTDGGTVKTKY